MKGQMNKDHDIEADLMACHARFSQAHGRGRAQLLASLSGARPIRVDFARRRFMLRGVAAAAVIAIVLGVFWMGPTEPAAMTPQMAWATALDQMVRVQSIHFRMSTPSPNGDSSVEVWWREGHEFRMVFGNGMIMTGNHEQRRILEPNKSLRIVDDVTPGPEMFVLGELGGLFDSEMSLSKDRHRKSEVIEAERIVYRGEQCLKITTVDQDFRYEYIVDMQQDAKMPLYEASFYSRSTPSKLRYRIEVLDINRSFADELFTVEPTPGIKIKN